MNRQFKTRMRWVAFIAMVVVVIACRKEANIVITDPPVIDTTATVQFSGMFINGPYGSVSGDVEIVKQNSSYILSLRNFRTSSGPDLHVYLSKEADPVNFVDLGTLRQATGNQDYSIPGNPDFSEYKYALIHCQAYNHLFGRAVLESK